ncbi:MAG: Acyl-CoA dehydrogenase [Alphaproteobacteria bacterium MarineAlpha4_Bin2]|nr:MAG: Acyl-CoA dehydrogenase [Alphaproteobacteria bacterium MarineAlpha4_Bin2]
MNFDFSDEQNLLREQARRFLLENAWGKSREIIEGEAPFDRHLWNGMAELGWMGAVVPEQYGGTGLTHEDLCIIAEEVGRSIAPTPFSSSVYLATEALLLAGSDEQKDDYLPRVVSGDVIGCFAYAEGIRKPTLESISTTYADGKLIGEKYPILDGDVADFAIVLAKTPVGEPVLTIASLDDVPIQTIETIDPSRSHGRLHFEGTPANEIGKIGDGWNLAERLLDRAAILFAFEQLGGAQRCLEMATEYAKERHAFGRPIGSFQAIKHKLADVFIATELARSHAYYGAWALTTDAPDLPLAAAAARVAASRAYYLAASENIQTHGGMGFTWELDCHLYYRRAKLLNLALGGERRWKHKLVARLESRNIAA